MRIDFRTGPEDRDLEAALAAIPARARSAVIRQLLRAAFLPGGLRDLITRIAALEAQIVQGAAPGPSTAGDEGATAFDALSDSERMQENWRSALAAFGAEDEWQGR